jgi:hypothetical protein
MSNCWECDRAERWEKAGRNERLRQIEEASRRIETLRREIRELESVVERGDREVAEHRTECPEKR